MRGEYRQIGVSGFAQELLKLGQFICIGYAVFIGLPCDQPIKEASFNLARVTQGGNAVHTGGFGV